jgi:PAS domain S-box-containing protein
MAIAGFPLSATDLFEGLPDACFLVSAEGRIQAANRAAGELCGRAFSAPQGDWFRELFRPDDRPLVDRVLYRTLRFGDRERITCELELAVAESRRVEIFSVEGTERELAVLVLRPQVSNSPERAWIDQETRRLHQRGDTLYQVAMAAGHNLKMPLVTIEANLALLERDFAAGQRELAGEDLAAVRGAVVRMRGLLDELLELGRLRRYDLSSLTSTTCGEVQSLDEITGDAIRLVSGRIEASQAEVRIASPLPSVRGRRRQLVEVFQNLIDNAAKFGAQSGRPIVEIGAEQRGLETVVYVRDNGPGIPVNDRMRIFDLFVQLNEQAGGTGIGLAIVRRIIAGHGGRIWAEDGPENRGASICFTLPLHTGTP